LKTEEIRGAKIESTRVSLGMGMGGITTTFRSQRFERLDSTTIVIPDVVTAIQSKTKLTKETIVRIIRESESFQKILTNPELFIDRAISIISEVLEELMIDGIKYEKT
jgi:type III restriction enzyme